MPDEAVSADLVVLLMDHKRVKDYLAFDEVRIRLKNHFTEAEHGYHSFKETSQTPIESR